MITKPQKKFLRKLAHELKSIIWIGQHGLTDNVIQEINGALDHHELLKLKINTANRKLRDQIAEHVCIQTRSELIQKTGNVIAIYRQHLKEPTIKLPEK